MSEAPEETTSDDQARDPQAQGPTTQQEEQYVTRRPA
jgi:hypothetical protein